jgi:hypothetical protein
MKRIYFILGILLFLLSGMTYLYFSNLNTNTVNSDLSLKLAANHSGLIFSIQNNKSVLDILKGQELFNNLIGREKVALLDALKEKLLSTSAFNRMINDQNIYISILPGENRQIDMLLSIEVTPEANSQMLLQALKNERIKVEQTENLYKIELSDSLYVYAKLEENVLLISTAQAQITSALNSQGDTENAFLEFVQKNDKLAKNSLASLYINYNQMPSLLAAITPAAKSGEFSILNRQNAFAHLSYNFSKERIFFSGETRINDLNSFYQLFSGLKPEKIEADKVLPDNTASYTIYCAGKYSLWQKKLNSWFVNKKEFDAIEAKKAAINSKYHLNLEGTFAANSGTQFITFQLKSNEKLAAIALTNGDKLSQLLLDLSDDYAGNIKLLKEPDIFYYYYGEPLKRFKRPYYVILNNYLFLSNNPSALQAFLRKYEAGDLLINNAAYTQIFDQLSNSANILFYLNNAQSQNVVIDNLYSGYYKHYRDPRGLKNFDSFIYQLSGDKESFQTNVFLNIKHREPQTDSLQHVEK